MKIYNLIFLFILFGCTSLSQKLQTLLEKKEPVVSVQPKKINNFCENKMRPQFLLEDSSYSQSIFNKNNSLSFVEKFVIISLIELGRRPDITSPYSRLQVIAKINGNFKYYDFKPEKLDDSLKIPFLYGLNILLKQNNSPQSLAMLAKLVDSSGSNFYAVSKEFENFLLQNKKDIQKNAELSKIYLKGDEVLTKFETFLKPNLQKSIDTFNKKKLFDNNHYNYLNENLNSTNIDENKNSTSCNFNIKEDVLSTKELAFDTDYTSNSFAYAENENYMVAITSSNISKPIELKDQFFLNAKVLRSPLPVCHLSNIGLNLDMILTSTIGRNPSQHLKHLLNYDIINSTSLELVSNTLNFARHLFLKNPDRILYESKKGRKEQLNFFLQMDFPIYHVDQIGDMMGIVNYKKNKFSNIIKDERSSKELTCIP